MIENFLIILTAITVIVLLKSSKKEKKKSYKPKQKNYSQPYKSNSINSSHKNLYNTIHTKSTYLSVSDLARVFKIKSDQVNYIFKELGWIEQNGKWLLVTDLGKKYGAEQKYNRVTKQKYVIWSPEVKNSPELIEKINYLKYSSNKEGSFKDREKKQKGDKYEAYIADFFRANGYYVWEHGKEKGVHDGGIDLFVKKDNYCYFVQCKDWETWRVDDKTVKATQTDVRNYMLNNPVLTKLLGDKKKKILYITSKECLTPGAYRYINANSHIIDYKVIPIEQ